MIPTKGLVGGGINPVSFMLLHTSTNRSLFGL